MINPASGLAILNPAHMMATVKRVTATLVSTVCTFCITVFTLVIWAHAGSDSNRMTTPRSQEAAAIRWLFRRLPPPKGLYS